MASIFLIRFLVCSFAVKNYATVVYMYIWSINVMPHPIRLNVLTCTKLDNFFFISLQIDSIDNNWFYCQFDPCYTTETGKIITDNTIRLCNKLKLNWSISYTFKVWVKRTSSSGFNVKIRTCRDIEFLVDTWYLNRAVICNMYKSLLLVVMYPILNTSVTDSWEKRDTSCKKRDKSWYM